MKFAVLACGAEFRRCDQGAQSRSTPTNFGDAHSAEPYSRCSGKHPIQAVVEPIVDYSCITCIAALGGVFFVNLRLGRLVLDAELPPDFDVKSALVEELVLVLVVVLVLH